MKTIERIFDATTGETTDIERDMTADEVRQHQEFVKRLEAEELERAEAEAKREAALSKLAALGLTADDLKALGL